VNEGLTPEERAYLFHIVKKSPILNQNFGRYFDYQGPVIKFPNKTLNYDSIELLIINKPELLVIRKEEIAKSPKGLIAEAANKMAIWELNKVLLTKRTSAGDLKQYKNEFSRFEELLKEELPQSAYRPKDGVNKPHPKVYNVINPGLSLDEKVAQVGALRFLSIDDQLLTLKAINHAVNNYVEERALQIYRDLGGEAVEFSNILVAAGDGSGTSGLLEEREKNERGIWNKGLPKAVGLFPYQLKIERSDEKRKPEEKIEPYRFAQQSFFTPGNNLLTNIHMDVWGYNSEKQTTVVIEKNGLTYHLFGSGETRFLSPDSSFANGATFQWIINDLEFNKIAKLNDKIEGKRGYDYWIKYFEKKKDATEIKLQKKEKEYSDLGYTPISTDKKASRRVKKSKRKAIKAGGGSGSFDGTPTTHSQRSDRKKLQDQIVHLYGQYEHYRRKIRETKEEKQIAVDLRAVYELRLDHFKQLMGFKWATYEEKDGMYIFEDSSTFDILTQEFQFKPSPVKEEFEVRLIAIPESCLNNSADEVMLHINVMDAKPDYDARINLELNDVFASDKWDLPKPLFNDEDSVALQVFFEGLLNKKTDFSMVARGQGVGKWSGIRTVKNYKPKELDRYPGNASQTKMDSTFLRLRKSEVIIRINRSIELEINSFTDPVKSSISVDNDDLSGAMRKYGLSKNDILSAHRTATIMKALKAEINVLAGKYLTREEAKIVIDRFNKTWSKTKVSVGRTSFKLSAL
jgi:hypothetical protein